jgi:hypothetical protein
MRKKDADALAKFIGIIIVIGVGIHLLTMMSIVNIIFFFIVIPIIIILLKVSFTSPKKVRLDHHICENNSDVESVPLNAWYRMNHWKRPNLFLMKNESPEGWEEVSRGYEYEVKGIHLGGRQKKKANKNFLTPALIIL